MQLDNILIWIMTLPFAIFEWIIRGKRTLCDQCPACGQQLEVWSWKKSSCPNRCEEVTA